MLRNIDKKRYLYAILMVILILIALFFSIWSDSSKDKGITAMEAKYVCDSYAKNWSENATLVEIRTSSVSKQGEADIWYLVYAIPTEIGNKTDAVEFKVFSDGNIIKMERSPGNYWGRSLEENWSLDSDKLISIATSNDKMKEWLSEFHDAEIVDFGIGINLIYSSNPICGISWSSWGYLDDPHSAEIIIDATTGEVLYVEADIPSGPTLYETVCLPPVIAAMTVLFLLIFVCGRFSSSLALGFSIFLLPVLYLRIYYSTLLFTLLTVIFWFILWWRVKKLGEGVEGVEVRRRMQAVTWVLAGDYFGLLLARFLLLPYTHPTLLWVLFILLNAFAIAVIADEEDRLGLRGLLRSMRK